MRSPILDGANRLLVLLLLAFSAFLLVRGHNEPGGGFVGGLVASVALALLGIARGPGTVRRVLRFDPRAVAGFGVLLALASGLVALPGGGTFLEGRWTSLLGLKIGTPLLFDVGVYLVVVGAVLALFLALEEDDG